MSSSAIVVRSQSRSKRCVIFIDSKQIGTLPPKGTVRTLVDPGLHIIETYWKDDSGRLRSGERWKMIVHDGETAKVRMMLLPIMPHSPALYPDGRHDFQWERAGEASERAFEYSPVSGTPEIIELRRMEQPAGEEVNRIGEEGNAPSAPSDGGRRPTGARAHEARTVQQTGEMAAGDRSVFISYRRKLSESLAWSVRRALAEYGFDAFVDLENLDSGEFERAILRQIEAREHFIVLLEPGSLDQIGEEGDWLRREIAHALTHGRNVVPVTAKGFEFRRDLVLPPDMARLPSFNAVAIPPGYFDAAMDRLRTRFLKKPPNPTAYP